MNQRPWAAWATFAIVSALGLFPAVSIAEPETSAAKELATQSQESQSTGRLSHDRPWFRNTTPENRHRAAQLDHEGNALLKQHLFAEAMIKYQEALRYWQHPRIYYHLTIAQIELGEDPVAVHENVQAALRYDGGGLTSEEQERARAYRKLLHRQLVEIAVVCEQPGVQVKLDGELLMTGPGAKRKLVKPGQYQITASKRGYLSVNQTVLLLPEEHKRVDLKLFTLAEVSGTKRYWNASRPWMIFGAGAAIAVLGGALHWRGSHNITKHDDLFAQKHPDGSPPGGDRALEGLLERGVVQYRLGIANYIAGGTALATGLVLALINRPRPYRIDRSAESFRVSLLPSISPEASGVSAAFSF